MLLCTLLLFKTQPLRKKRKKYANSFQYATYGQEASAPAQLQLPRWRTASSLISFLFLLFCALQYI